MDGTNEARNHDKNTADDIPGERSPRVKEPTGGEEPDSTEAARKPRGSRPFGERSSSRESSQEVIVEKIDGVNWRDHRPRR